MSVQQRLRERLKKQRDARLKSKTRHIPYGVSLQVFDQVQAEVKKLYETFPSISAKQVEHFILPHFTPSVAESFKTFPPELRDHVCAPVRTPQEHTNNQRVRDVIQSREIVDASNGNAKVAMQQHKLLKEKYSKDFVKQHLE